MSRQWNNRTRCYTTHGRRGATAQKRTTARSRCLFQRKTRQGIVVVLLFVGIMGIQVALSNGVVSQGCRVTELKTDRTYYQARVGILEHRWNSMTSRDVIVSRAGQELGLALQEDPARIVVLVSADPEPKRRDWPGWLRSIGGGTEAQAATGRRSP